MIAISPMEALVLIVLSTGGGSNDVVSFLNPEAYFKTHGIMPGVEQMTELAGKDPTEPKTQVAQLLAIRWLGAHAEDAKKSDKARALLAQIAEGKKANDPYGFARDHAQRALARIEGKPAPAGPAIPADSLRTEGLKWFPADVTLVAGMDLRASGESKPRDEDLAGMIARLMPGDAQELMALAIDQMGNLRLDRLAVAVKADGQGVPERTYVRFTGAGNLKLWAAFLQQQMLGGKTSEVKGPRGETITLLVGDPINPALAFIGDTDVLLAVPTLTPVLPRNKAKPQEMLEQALEVMAGKKPSAATGPLQGMLKEVPAQAFGMAVGDVPEGASRMFSALPAVPQRFAATLSRDKAIQVGVRAVMKDADAAKKLADGLYNLKKQALEAIKNPPPQQPFPPALLQMAGKILTVATVKVKDAEVIGSLTIPAEAPQDLRKALEGIRPPGEATKPKEPGKPKE